MLSYGLVLSSVFFVACKAFYTEDGISLADKSTFAHNYVRDLHLVSNLIWDSDQSIVAQQYANELAAKNSIQHSEGSKNGYYGENIYKGFDGFKRKKTVAEAVYYWYLEIDGYDFSNPNPNFELTGHFTELVWRSTTRVGCGVAYKEIYGGLMTYVVCQYRPQGNLIGQFIQNVLPMGEGGSVPNSPQQLEAPIGCIDTYTGCSKWTGVCRQTVFRDLMLRYCKKTCNIC